MQQVIIIFFSLIIATKSSAAPFVLTTVGDSLSSGVFAGSDPLKMSIKSFSFKEWAISFLFEAPKYVYSDGANINSVKKQLTKAGQDVISYNYAVAGSTTYDVLSKQVIRVVNQKRRSTVTLVWVGANDLGVDEKVEKSIERMGWIVRALTNVSDRVVILPLPRLYLLHENVSQRRNRFFIKCEKVWDTLGLLKPITKWGKERKEANMVWIQKYNEGIDKLAGGNVMVAHEVARLDPIHSLVSSVECTHLARPGQELVASLVFPYTVK